MRSSVAVAAVWLLVVGLSTADETQASIKKRTDIPAEGPAVVGYLSEVPVPISGPGLYYDLQSVEVLKGPQGTLFGRNTTGGAVLFEPHRPDLRTVQGYGQLLGGDYSRGEVQAAINVPVIEDKLAVRVAGQIGSRAGYTRDADTGVGYDNRHFRAARIGILFHPNEVLENYVIGNYVAFNEHGPGASLMAANPANPFLGAGILDYVAAQQTRGIRATALDVAELDQGILYTLINKTSLELNDNLKLRNILSYSRQRIRRQDDEDGIVLALLDSLGSNSGTWLVDQETVTEERSWPCCIASPRSTHSRLLLMMPCQSIGRY
jgi:iron complex outermembrane receptor protein